MIELWCKINYPRIAIYGKNRANICKCQKSFKRRISLGDLGSFGSADAYLIILTSLNGRCLCVEGEITQKMLLKL